MEPKTLSQPSRRSDAVMITGNGYSVVRLKREVRKEGARVEEKREEEE